MVIPLTLKAAKPVGSVTAHINLSGIANHKLHFDAFYQK
jgi:hypothetical protein